MRKTYLLVSAIIFFSITSCTEDVPEVKEPDSVLAVANAIDGTKIFPIVEQLTAFHLSDSAISFENFPPGVLFPSDHLTRSSAVGYISYVLRENGYSVDVMPLGDEPLVAYNVVAEHTGTTHPDEVVLVAAHLDAFYGGADDNSSSIAALLEISRAVKDFSFARTIRFVAFDLEEFGSIGSTRYVKGGYADDVKSAVVMDMIGYSSDEPGSQKNVKGLRVPDVGDFIFVVGNQKSAELTQKVVSLSNSAQLAKTVGIITPNDGAYFLSSVFMRSDHGLLWYRGIPAIFFTDGGNFRNPHYHEPSDLPETLNKDFLIANTRLIAATVAILAEVKP